MHAPCTIFGFLRLRSGVKSKISVWEKVSFHHVPPVWKEIAVTEAKRAWLPTFWERGCCLRHESIYGLKDKSTALRMCQVPGWGAGLNIPETCPA